MQGRLLVTESLVNLTEKRPDGSLVNQHNGNQGLKANLLPTTGIVLGLKMPGKVLARPGDARVAFNGLDSLLTGLLPAVLGPCDLADFAIHPQWADDEARLYLYDNAYDGIDLTIQAFARLGDLLAAALMRVRECDCVEAEGCFRCVRNPHDDVPTSRNLTRDLLKVLATSIESKPITITVDEAAPDRMAPIAARVVCPKCGSSNALGQKFCGDCGQRLEGT